MLEILFQIHGLENRCAVSLWSFSFRIGCLLQISRFSYMPFIGRRWWPIYIFLRPYQLRHRV